MTLGEVSELKDIPLSEQLQLLKHFSLPFLLSGFWEAHQVSIMPFMDITDIRKFSTGLARWFYSCLI